MLYIVPIEDSTYGRRELSAVVNDNIMSLAGTTQTTVYQSESGLHINDMIDAINDFLSSQDWRYISQVEYLNSGEMARMGDIIPLLRTAFPNATQGHFSSTSPYNVSDYISVFDTVTEFRDFGKLNDTLDGFSGTCVQRGVNDLPSFPCSSSYGNYSRFTGNDPLSQQSLTSFNVKFVVYGSDIMDGNKFKITDETYRVVVGIVFFFYTDFFGEWAESSCAVEVSSLGSAPQTAIDIFTGQDAEQQDIPEDDRDPYGGGDDTGGNSDTGGGQGGGDSDNRDPDSDPNPVPSLPSVSATDTGFITLYNPSLAQMKSLASYMWGQNFDINLFKKVVADPMDTILGLSIVPVAVQSGGVQNVKVGNIDTGVSMTKASSQYIELNCGTIALKEYWKAYLDYSPYTRISIFLPFIGSQELDVDILQSTSVGVVYHIDILNGGCIAFVTSDGDVIAQFSGQCAVSVPVTSKDFTQTIMALTSLVAGGVGVVATGGLSAPVSGAMIAGVATASANTANNVISSKPTFAKSGNVSGSNGLLGVQKPYLIIEKPKQCVPKYQNTFTGYPSYITSKLSLLTGFTQVQDIHLDVACTDEEHNEIMGLLHSGVIL